MERMRGVTLIEIIFVVAVFGILALMIAPAGNSWRASRELEGAAASVLDALAEARERTLQSKSAMRYGVAFDGNTPVVFVGDSYSVGAQGNEAYDLSEGITLVPALSEGAAVVVFTRLSGEASATGTIAVNHETLGVSRTITIYATGLSDER